MLLRLRLATWLAALAIGAASGLLVLRAVAGTGVLPSTGLTRAHIASHPWAVPLTGEAAPPFTLRDQFGHKLSLTTFRGREVVLAFVDAQCKSVCPLTAEILRASQMRLGMKQASRAVLVGINANPVATSVRTTYHWSLEHGMLHRWEFLTGSPRQLQAVYEKYRVYDRVMANKSVVHGAAVIILDSRGRERLYFDTADTKDAPTVQSEEIAYESGMRRWLPS